MLEESSGKNSRLAWLHDSKEPRSARILGRSLSAKTGHLSFFAPDFALTDSRPWLIGEPLALQPQPLLTARIPLPHLHHRADPSPTHFAQAFEDIQLHIGDGEFEKVVPMIAEQLEYEHPLNLAMFPPFLQQRYEGRYSYGFEFEGEGMCGVTPELLFSVDGGVLKTMALAGTGEAGGPSLLSDPKERHEHQVVIDYLIQALKPWGEVMIGATHEKEFGVLKHLRTEVEVRLNREPDFSELVKALHPTAALGGWPRDPAWAWLEAQEFHKTRRRFGAPFGYADGRDGKMLCVVAIRGVQWEKHCARISAGCGIVRESQPLREWHELQLKLKAIHQLLGMDGE